MLKDDNDIDSIELQQTEQDLPKRRSFIKRLWRFVWKTALCLILLPVFLLLVYKWVNPPLTPLMVQRFFQQVGDKEREVTFKRDYVSIEDISPNMVTAVISSEDGRFMRHKGFDIPMLKQSYRENKRGRRVRGGSTISMQTAKNAFLPHKRSYLRKGLEAGFTIGIEKLWGKERIMEVYLNIIEFGDGIYGCEAASQHYFGHSAKTLSRHEAAQLAVTLPSPLKRNPGNQTPYFKKQTSVVEGRMSKYGKINLKSKPKKDKKAGKNSKKKEDDETLWDFIRWMRKQK